jgi:hypothetical protein
MGLDNHHKFLNIFLDKNEDEIGVYFLASKNSFGFCKITYFESEQVNNVLFCENYVTELKNMVKIYPSVNLCENLIRID